MPSFSGLCVGSHEPILHRGTGRWLSLRVPAKYHSITAADARLIAKSRFVGIMGVKTTEMFADLSAQLAKRGQNTISMLNSKEGSCIKKARGLCVCSACCMVIEGIIRNVTL